LVVTNNIIPHSLLVTQWRSKGGKWGAGLGGATAHFLQSF